MADTHDVPTDDRVAKLEARVQELEKQLADAIDLIGTGGLTQDVKNLPDGYRPHGIDTLTSHVDLQVFDDDADASTAEYNAGMRLWAEQGKLLAAIAADTVHNHLGAYTRKYPIDGPNKRIKRINFQGGTLSEHPDFDKPLADTVIRTYAEHNNTLQLSANYDGTVRREAIVDGSVRWRHEVDPVGMVVREYDPLTGHVYRKDSIPKK